MNTRRRNKGNGPSFRALTAKELSGFDLDARELILTAIDAGCTGRVSRKGHAILRNNTGVTSSVSRHLTTQNRTAQNARAQIKRLIDSHRSENAPLQGPATTSETTVSVNQALTDYAMEFSNWLSREAVDAAPTDPIRVTLHPDGTHGFVLESGTKPWMPPPGRTRWTKSMSPPPSSKAALCCPTASTTETRGPSPVSVDPAYPVAGGDRLPRTARRP